MEIDSTKLTTFFMGVIGLILLPLGLIWAFNTLLNLQIEYSFINWLSIVFIQVYIQIVLKASFISSNKK
tara:strand:- start:386 stop:592 length:207 start_codon:yes stop_codon:yes gene_type:complete